MTELSKRIYTGVLLVFAITLSIRIHAVSFILLITLINLLALLEFYRLFRSSTQTPRVIAGVALSFSLLVSLTLFLTNVSGWKIMLINIPVAFSIFIIELYSRSNAPFHNLAFTFLGIIFITIPLCFFISIAFNRGSQWSYEFQIPLGYFFILWAGDSCAYVAGKTFGRHKLFKRISPKKTVEGSIGSLVASLLVAYITSLYFTSVDESTWIGMGIIIVIAGTFGDLIKSMMKRSLGVKDSGNMLPGHGGILDRFDSLLGSAPFVFCFLALYPIA
ncbi:phosphatidate cytidylyltransferase [Chitinophaga oryziterrae]|uniref:Phosphatidate cytidylyltransferase n=2 Tax=Chitinophaga oryziterrae TaxID=1031224 RepID=A0A6N8JH79_9BACT|nr:phosphatidate cytidylyltransferase [Chitinophaga oryziterrae]